MNLSIIKELLQNPYQSDVKVTLDESGFLCFDYFYSHSVIVKFRMNNGVDEYTINVQVPGRNNYYADDWEPTSKLGLAGVYVRLTMEYKKYLDVAWDGYIKHGKEKAFKTAGYGINLETCFEFLVVVFHNLDNERLFSIHLNRVCYTVERQLLESFYTLDVFGKVVSRLDAQSTKQPEPRCRMVDESISYQEDNTIKYINYLMIASLAFLVGYLIGTAT